MLDFYIVSSLKQQSTGSDVGFLQCQLTETTVDRLGESGTLLIFKVKGQCHRVKFLLRNILVNTRINILQWILTKLGTYLDLKRLWNPIDFQGQRSRSQGLIFRRGICHALRCPCLKMCHLLVYIFTNLLDSRKFTDVGITLCSLSSTVYSTDL